MRQLTALDTQFLALENGRAYGHVSGLAVYDPSTAPGGELTRERVRDLIAERLHLLPPFRWRLQTIPFGLDRPFWIDDPEFDLDYHVRELALPAPGDREQLARQVERLIARQLDRKRPLWELYVISGLEQGRVALLTKVHHSAVDGVSGGEILGILLDQEPERAKPSGPPPEPEQGGPPPSAVEMLARGIVSLPGQPLRALRALPSTLPNLDDIPGVRDVPGVGVLRGVAEWVARSETRGRDGRVLERSSARAPRTRFSSTITPHRRVAIGSCSLAEVKEVKNALGVTVNDAVVAMCTGGLRAWLDRRGELPDTCLVAMVPVSVRKKDEEGTFGNRVSVMTVPIPTVEPDAITRVERCHEILRAAKERHRATPASLMQDVSEFIPPAIHARAARVTTELTARRPFRPPMNVTISNVPGSSQPLYIAGAELHHHYPVSAIADGVGLNITVMSYRDHLDFGIVACRDQLEDPWEMLDDVIGELAVLQDAIAAEPAGART